MRESLRAIDANDLQATPDAEGGRLSIRFEGSADSRSQAAIESLLTALHEEARERGAREVEINFQAFDFISSSCFKAFVVWLSQIQDLPAAEQYRVRFLANDAKSWQRRSLGALTSFAIDIVAVESRRSP